MMDNRSAGEPFSSADFWSQCSWRYVLCWSVKNDGTITNRVDAQVMKEATQAWAEVTQCPINWIVQLQQSKHMTTMGLANLNLLVSM